MEPALDATQEAEPAQPAWFEGPNGRNSLLSDRGFRFGYHDAEGSLGNVDMIDRRTAIASTLAALVSPLAMRGAQAEVALSRITAYAFSFSALGGGKDIPLADYTGRPLMVVNTASLCGYTPQYAGLQQIWTEFGARGFAIVGVPSNDFGAQEPGSTSDIAETAQHQYAVTFPIAAKAVVVGPDAHPFYRWAAQLRPKDVPRWNFHKYLVGRDGYIADVFRSAVEPTDTRIKTAIAKALADA
jgi:glutathione peroxidase